MALKVLPPDEAKKKARENLAAWKRQKEMAEQKRRVRSPTPESDSDRSQPGWSGVEGCRIQRAGAEGFEARIVLQHQDGLGHHPIDDVVLSAPAITIGREPSNNIVLTDMSVSRHHAELRLERVAGGWIASIADCGSSNGTSVNGERVSLHKRRIQTGDIIGLGPNISFRVKEVAWKPER